MKHSMIRRDRLISETFLCSFAGFLFLVNTPIKGTGRNGTIFSLDCTTSHQISLDLALYAEDNGHRCFSLAQLRRLRLCGLHVAGISILVLTFGASQGSANFIWANIKLQFVLSIVLEFDNFISMEPNKVPM